MAGAAGVGLAVLAYAGEAAAFGNVCLALGVGSLVVGFWVQLFNSLERRLADIQLILAAQAPEEPQPEPSIMVPSKPRS